MHLYLDKVNRNQIESETLKEYISIKDKNSDCIILFQIGTFYETFFEDAKILSDITGMTLSSRNFKGVGAVAQCGFSSTKNINFHIKQLLSNGYKVCFCTEEQNTDEKIKRKIIRTYTKGTLFENDFLNSEENNYILALYDNKQNILLSYADVSTGQFFKTSGSLEEIMLEVEKIEPNEILILNNQKYLSKNIANKSNITYLNDEYKNKCIEEIIKAYCKQTQKDYCAELNKIKEYSIYNYLALDETTRKNLELTRTKMFSKKKGSLFWFLNNTKTPMGSRLLKKYLSEPLLDIEKIKKRQSAIEELKSNKELLSDLEKTLTHFSDLSRMCAHISNSTISPKDLYRISQNSSFILNLTSLITKIKSPLLKLDKKNLEKIIDFYSKIEKAINEDSPDELKGGGIIKENYDANLDYLKSKLSNFEKEVEQFEKKEQKKLDIEKLTVSFSKIIGYYIEIPNSKIQRITKEYFKKQSLTNVTRFSTDKLQELEENIFNLKYKINQYEYALFCEIRNKAKEFIEIIRKMAYEIARIDVLTSLARCALDNNFVKPEFNKNGIFIKNGYHPSLLKLNNEIIKNDTELEDGTMIILTGANMSGKSTYLKHNAIICLLAQIGSFIPANYANLSIVDKLFLRQGVTDDIINNNSSFMVEMNDLKYIIDNMTNSSFILLDEPAKSTNSQEGGAIARAFCEYLLEHYHSKVILTTHNLELTKIEKTYPKRAHNYVVGSANPNEFTINDRKIVRGIVNKSLAINTASLAKLPLELIEKAKLYIQDTI